VLLLLNLKKDMMFGLLPVAYNLYQISWKLFSWYRSWKIYTQLACLYHKSFFLKKIKWSKMTLW